MTVSVTARPHPERWIIRQRTQSGLWEVWPPYQAVACRRYFSTHAKAITYVDHQVWVGTQNLLKAVRVGAA